MTFRREDVLREFLCSKEIQATGANPQGQIVFFDCDAMADEIVRLRKQVEHAREIADHLLGFVLVADGGGFRPQAGSYVTPLEFHQATTHAMRELLANLGKAGA